MVVMVEIGQKAFVHYTGFFDDGTEFDSGFGYGQVLELVIGSKKMLPAFERAVSEMSIGEKRTIHVPAAQAYGSYDADSRLILPTADVPSADSIHEGGSLAVVTPLGSQRLKVVRVENGQIELDCNHELAGHDLNFAIQLVSVEHLSAIDRERRSTGCACGCDKLKHVLSA